MDDDENKTLDQREFAKGIHDFGLVEFDRNQIDELFHIFDRDGNGKIDFDEFLTRLRVKTSTSHFFPFLIYNSSSFGH